MVHADHQEPSYFNKAANQVQQQVCQLYLMAAPTRNEVFEYLDEHPDALQQYLDRVRHAGVLGLFDPIFEERGILDEEAASENEVQDSASDQVDLWELVAAAEQAVQEVEYEDRLDFVDLADEDSADIEVVPQAGPEVPFDNVELEAAVDSDSDDDANGVTPPASEDEADDEDDDESDASSVDNDVDNNDAPVAAAIAPVANPNPNIMPYPAPAHLVAESRNQPPGRSWALWEEESCIRHMIDVSREDQLRGEARFHEALRRMRTIDNCPRDKPNAVKNFWNRVGRARSGLDERRNKSAPLSTSKQGKQTKASKRSSPSQRKPTSSGRVAKHQTTNRRQKTPEYSSSEESDFRLSDNEQPTHLRHSRKRKDSDNDSEDDWEPSAGYLNAVAKGLRAPKRSRTAAAQ